MRKCRMQRGRALTSPDAKPGGGIAQRWEGAVLEDMLQRRLQAPAKLLPHSLRCIFGGIMGIDPAEIVSEGVEAVTPVGTCALSGLTVA